MKLKFYHITFISAILLLSISAYFSVYGLSYLFAGSKIPVIIMASALELAKIVATSFLYRWHKDLRKIWKMYLTTSIVILMLITSVGIYGYLSNAYQSTATKISDSAQIETIKNTQKTDIDNRIKFLQDQIDLAATRYKSLTDTRQAQEKRLNDAMEKNQSRKFMNGLREDIKETNKEIQDLTASRTKSNNEIITLMGDRSKLQKDVADANKETAKIDFGPLRYLSRLMNKSMDQIVNFLILFLIFTFDPLAVVLIIATNMQIEKQNNSEKNNIIKDMKKQNKPRLGKKVQVVPLSPLERLLWGAAEKQGKRKYTRKEETN